MAKVVVTLEIEVVDKNIDIYMSDDIGGSGVSLKGNDNHKVSEEIADYISDYINNLEEDDE